MSPTEIKVTITPEKAGEIVITLAESIKSVSGRTLDAPPSLTLTYKGAVVSQSSVLAYDRYALVTVTANKAAHLYCLVFPKKIAVTPSVETVMNSGVLMSAVGSKTSYTANVTSLTPESDYVVFVAGREPFGPHIATPVSDTRTSFSTVGVGEKPSTGKQCAKGWATTNGLLLYSQCSNRGVCSDGVCVCNSPYTGTNCGVLTHPDIKAANETHHLVHTMITVTGAIPSNDEDQDVFLQTSLQLGGCLSSLLEVATAHLLQIDSSLVQIHLWEHDTREEAKIMLRAEEKRLRQKGVLPFFPRRMSEVESLYIHVCVDGLAEE